MPGQLPPALFSLQENVVGIAELLFPPLPDLAEAVPVTAFEIVEGIEQLEVNFRLQLLRVSLVDILTLVRETLFWLIANG